MDELKITQEVGELLKFIAGRKLTPAEKIMVFNSASAIVTQVFIQTASFEKLEQEFKPINRKTVN